MSAKIADIVRDKVGRLPIGYVFTYEDVMSDVETRQAVIKALNRLVESGRVSKLSKGKFYKPEKTVFGELMPPQEEIVKDLLLEDGKVVGYLTGLSVYNRLGLTTQVGNTIEVARNNVRSSFKRERYRIKVIRQKNIITKENYPLLQLLDVLRFIKKIPDSSIAESIARMVKVISVQTDDELKRMVRLSSKYPPSTRALFGAILDELEKGELARPLQNSLNPISTYKLEGSDQVLRYASKWNLT